MDAPLFFNLNRTFDSFETLNGLILIGTNPRFEASLLNTSLRKQQLNRALPYLSIGTYSTLKFKYNHAGNSLKTLFALLKNENAAFHNFYNLENTSIILGVESLKNKGAFLIQNLVRILGKKLIVKTKKGDRLGLLHANTTSLTFANLGVDSGVRSPLHLSNIRDKKINNLFSIQPHEISPKK